MSVDGSSNSLGVASEGVQKSVLLTVDGLLDSSTYLLLRDRIIKAALDDPPAVIVDVTALQVPAESALAVFTSARWHLEQWLDVPIALVCTHTRGREALIRNGIARYLPVYETAAEAISEISARQRKPHRRRARAELPPAPDSISGSRQLVAEWLTAWSREELIPVTKLVVSVLVENVLAHTQSAPSLRLESAGETVTIAVEDGNPAPATRRECSQHGGDDVSGLAIVAALCRTWGNAPTSSGKTVWAVIGPENRL